MRMLATKRWPLLAIVTTILLASLAPSASFADDDKDKKSEPAKAAPAKPDAPAPLTERERMLLDRVEQLEKRVAELEAKQPAGAAPTALKEPSESGTAAAGVSATAPAAEATAAQPKPAEAAQLAAAPSAGAAVGATPASPDSTNAGNSGETAAPGTATAAAVGQDQNAQANAAATTGKPANVEPFSDADWTWLNGSPRTKDIYWDSKFFTPEIRVDTNYVADFNHPEDHTIDGSSELFRSYEVQLEQLGLGGDFHYDNVRGRFMTQFGMYSATTPRNDASPGHGQWDLDTAYRYLAEAYGGYHFNVLHGVNVDAGIFLSYIGLFSYYNFDNWAYQPSYVSSNTPWFFNGVRVQIFPTAHLKIEPWFINGWQSYASANHSPGLGGQIKWTPRPWLNIISNNYGLGQDDLFVKGRSRIHTDNSVEVKYYDNPEKNLDKMAFSLTGDLGCEYGAGVSCYGDRKGGPKQSFIGYMAYNRFWFHNDLFGVTVGGGQINNPGRYLVLIPPINGETAISAATNSPYFTGNPGDPYKAWDSSFTFDYMPKQYITFRAEYDYRHASVPYWSGAGGITPPGGNNGSPQFYACSNGSSSGQGSLSPAEAACGGGLSSLWFPDLRKNESFIDLSIMVKF
ncbi:MAG: outer membrane beta-barrel protein [Candidatus Acidiferrum sp.]